MGRDKATLPFGPELMLQRVVRLVSEAVPLENIVVVAAPTQSLPTLPSEVIIAHDDEAFRGPLQGLATGMQALGPRIDAAYATACDVPLLVPAFIEQMFELLAEFDAAVPVDGAFHHPLAAVYRHSVLSTIRRLLDCGQSRPRFLFDEVRTIQVPVDALRPVDPELATLVNLNHEEDYRAALAAAGYRSLPGD